MAPGSGSSFGPDAGQRRPAPSPGKMSPAITGKSCSVRRGPWESPPPQQTKNYNSTRFPCGDRLSRFLRSLPKGDRTDPVLPGIKGGPLHYQNFQRRHWQPIVSQMAKDGAIAFYLSQYHARHTWITAALAVGMDPKDVSYLARVSIEVLYRHYVGRSRRIIVPEF
jgi:integrase